MPVSYMTYVYATFMIASFGCSILALIRRDETRLEVFALATLLAMIGFFSNLYAIQAV